MERRAYKPLGSGDGKMRTALHFGRQKINVYGPDVVPRIGAHEATHGSQDVCFRTHTPLGEW